MSTGVEALVERVTASGQSWYQEALPAEDLRSFVACVWVRVLCDGLVKRSPIIPDGCADIMVWDDAPPFVAGPDATTRWITVRDGVVITGIRLRPGAARAVLGCAASDILNGGARLADLAPGAAALHHRLLLTARLRERQTLLEGWVRAALARSGRDDRAVIAACRQLTEDPHAAIGAIARRLDWNARRIHREFHAACGYGPKHFQRIMRIQRAIRAVHAAPAPRLADIALAAGYADQAHMGRDFRDITGFTPAGYLATARPEYGAWIDGDW